MTKWTKKKQAKWVMDPFCPSFIDTMINNNAREQGLTRAYYSEIFLKTVTYTEYNSKLK